MTETKPTTNFLGSTSGNAAVRIDQCQEQWDELQPSVEECVRFCDHCQQSVHQLANADGFQWAQGQCAMVSGWSAPGKAESVFVGKPGAASYAIDTSYPAPDQ